MTQAEQQKGKKLSHANDNVILLKGDTFMAMKKLLALSIGSMYSITAVHAQPHPQEVEFNASFLRSNVDISQFSKGNPVDSGIHQVNLYVNNNWKGRHEVLFEQLIPGDLIAQPCFNLETLQLLDINMGKLNVQTLTQLEQAQQCVPFKALVEGGIAEYDGSNQRLNVSVPQIFLHRQSRRDVNPSLWDDGVTAATLQYDYNAYQSKLDGVSTQTNQYLGLRSGANFGPWRLRHRGAFQWNSEKEEVHYQNSSIYLERGISDWKSRLTLGDTHTDGQIFDSVSFRGVQLASDDRMFPDSARGFAPVVRGIANSNALVRISQNGSSIYETTVPPGAFAIDDLYPTGRGSDLLVTIKEADGSEHSFTVPYSPIPELLRPKTTRFSLVAGQFQSNSIDGDPAIAMGTIRHGFSNLLTGYGGVVAAEGYVAASLGMAFNTKWGALATDVTRAHTELSNASNQSGNSLRLSYAKVLPVTNTNLAVTASRSTSEGYYDTKDALTLRNEAKQGNTLRETDWRQRSRVSVSASQTLPKNYGSFSVNTTYQENWDQRKAHVEYQLSYNNVYKQVSYSVAAQRARNLSSDKWENQLMFSLSMPLGRNKYSPNWRSGVTKLSDSTTFNNSLSGSFGENSQYNYSVFTNTTRPKDAGSTTSYGGNTSWAAPYATVGISASTGKNYSQYGVNLSGAVVAYSQGVVFIPSVGETLSIVEVPQAQGAKINGYNNLILNSSGKTVVPYLNPYRQNTVEIDPRGLSTDVELQESSQNIAPTAGAVTLIKFTTDVGYSILINGQKSNGQPLPFGAAVLDAQGQNMGYIAQGSQAIIRVKDVKGELLVQWGNTEEDRCSFNYQVDSVQALPTGDFRRLDVICY